MRTAFNEAIEQGIIKKDRYPFGRRRFLIPESSRKKPVIAQNYIPLIMNYQNDDIRKMRAKDFWMFLYQGNGMNVKDLCYLKYKNIKGCYFSFIRAKVESTSSNKAKEVCVFITEDMWETIRKYGNQIETPETFIFPFLKDDLNPLQADDRVETIIYQINKWMKVIFEELGINERSSTLLTRYSIANHLKQLGASTEVIKDLLGHSSVKTTEIYLNSFEVNVNGGYIKQLMDKHMGFSSSKEITDVEMVSDIDEK
jgi:site-specific recombinase XerD